MARRARFWMADEGVKIVDTFPDGSYPPIIYPIATGASSTHPEDADCLAYLTSSSTRPFRQATVRCP